MIHVIVADDQALIRGALSVLIDLEDDMRVVAQAADGREAIAAVEAYTAENSRGDQASKAASTLVVIMDVEMPVMDGISAAAALKERGANARVLMVTTFGRPGYVQRALDRGSRWIHCQRCTGRAAPRSNPTNFPRTAHGRSCARGRCAHERSKPAQRARS